METKAKITVTIDRASLTYDACTFSIMDPWFYAFLSENKEKNYRSKVKKDEGKYPCWNETFSFPIDKEILLKIEVCHEKELIGTAEIYLEDIMKKAKYTGQHALLYDGKVRGTICGTFAYDKPDNKTNTNNKGGQIIFPPQNNNVINPNVINPNVINPNVINPNVINPNVINPNVINPNVINPNVINPNVINPNVINPNVINPNVINPIIPGNNLYPSFDTNTNFSGYIPQNTTNFNNSGINNVIPGVIPNNNTMPYTSDPNTFSNTNFNNNNSNFYNNNNQFNNNNSNFSTIYTNTNNNQFSNNQNTGFNNTGNFTKTLYYFKNPVFFQNNTTSVWHYDLNNKLWKTSQNHSQEFFPTYLRAAELPDGSFFVTGGDYGGQSLNSSYIFANGVAIKKENMLVGRKAHSTAYARGSVFVFGGFSYNNSVINYCEKYDVNFGGGWKQIAQMNLPRAYSTTLVYGDSSIFVIGGFTGQNVNGFKETDVIEQYDIATDRFDILKVRLSSPLYGCVATLISDYKILIAGGWSDTTKYSRKVYTIDLSSGKTDFLPDLDQNAWSVMPAYYHNGFLNIFTTGEETDNLPVHVSYYLNLNK